MSKRTVMVGEFKPEAITDLHRMEFGQAMKRATKAAHGDSNDEEIQFLQEAIELACDLLGITIEEVA